MYTKLIVNGTTLASPSKIKESREIIWSSSTGRSAKTGEMIGSVIANKITLDVEWTNITSAEYTALRSALSAGFFGPVKYQTSGGTDITTIASAYRGEFQAESKGYVGGTHYYSTVSVSIIEK